MRSWNTEAKGIHVTKEDPLDLEIDLLTAPLMLTARSLLLVLNDGETPAVIEFFLFVPNFDVDHRAISMNFGIQITNQPWDK
jgi:hypothetical protein